MSHKNHQRMQKKQFARRDGSGKARQDDKLRMEFLNMQAELERMLNETEPKKD